MTLKINFMVFIVLSSFNTVLFLLKFSTFTILFSRIIFRPLNKNSPASMIRSLVSRVGSKAGLKANGAGQSALIALLTTLISVLVVVGLNRAGRKVSVTAPVYAVGA